MLGRFQSPTVITACLFVAICSLFLRALVYNPPYHSDITKTDENTDLTPPPIILAYHERPPYYVTGKDNILTGLVGKQAHSAFIHSGLQFSCQRMPSKRQLNSVQNNTERICAVGWFKTAEREIFARFTQPIYQDRPTSVLTRKEAVFSQKNQTVQQLLATTGLTLLMKNSYSYGDYIDQALKKSSVSVVTTTGNTGQMLEMVASGKADFFFITTEEAEEAIATSTTPEMFRLFMPDDMPAGNERHIMCSKQVTPEEISLLDASIVTNFNPEGTSVRKQ